MTSPSSPNGNNSHLNTWIHYLTAWHTTMCASGETVRNRTFSNWSDDVVSTTGYAMREPCSIRELFDTLRKTDEYFQGARDGILSKGYSSNGSPEQRKSICYQLSESLKETNDREDLALRSLYLSLVRILKAPQQVDSSTLQRMWETELNSILGDGVGNCADMSTVITQLYDTHHFYTQVISNYSSPIISPQRPDSPSPQRLVRSQSPYISPQKLQPHDSSFSPEPEPRGPYESPYTSPRKKSSAPRRTAL